MVVRWHKFCWRMVFFCFHIFPVGMCLGLMEERGHWQIFLFIHHVLALVSKMLWAAGRSTQWQDIPKGQAGLLVGLEKPCQRAGGSLCSQKCVSTSISHNECNSFRLPVHWCLAGQPHACHVFVLSCLLQNQWHSFHTRPFFSSLSSPNFSLHESYRWVNLPSLHTHAGEIGWLS